MTSNSTLIALNKIMQSSKEDWFDDYAIVMFVNGRIMLIVSTISSQSTISSHWNWNLMGRKLVEYIYIYTQLSVEICRFHYLMETYTLMSYHIIWGNKRNPHISPPIPKRKPADQVECYWTSQILINRFSNDKER